MNRRFAVNLVAGITVLLFLVLMARSMNYQPARVPERLGTAAHAQGSGSATDAPAADAGTGVTDAATPGADVAAPDASAETGVAPPDLSEAARWVRYSNIGFVSVGQLSMHFAKHGAEFGAPTEDAYLLLAQSLRDRPAGGDVLEAARPDGVTCRFDRASGAFLACNSDWTIRTFFRPTDGEAYFDRQLAREH